MKISIAKCGDMQLFGFGVIYAKGLSLLSLTNPIKVGSGPMSGRDATWGQHIRVL